MNTIQFVPSNSETTSIWSPKTPSAFSDQILKPQYKERKLRFKPGLNWFRIVPAIEPSAFGWMLGLRVQNYPGGKFVHPRTLTANARSAFDHAYEWSKANHPGTLFSKENRSGIRLLTDPMTLCWVIAEEKDKPPVARLLLASGYDGSRSSRPGLGHQIWNASKELDEEGKVVTDAVDALVGVRMCVEMTQPAGVKFPSYSIRMGRNPMPIDPIVESLSPEERKVLTPLENVVEQIDMEEQWACLAKVIAPETVDEIRMSLTPAK